VTFLIADHADLLISEVTVPLIHDQARRTWNVLLGQELSLELVSVLHLSVFGNLSTSVALLLVCVFLSSGEDK